MLKRIYVNNFRCLVNFELQVDSLNLFLGSNGSGKTTVFEVLRKLQKFILGDRAFEQDYKVSDLFANKDLTRWQKSNIQKFELDIEGNNGLYTYILEIEHQGEYAPPRMRLESLTFDGQPLFNFWVDPGDIGITVGQARLYNDDPNRESVYLPFFDGSRSGIGFIYERSDNQKLTWFKKRISNFFIVQINPYIMESESLKEESSPNWDMSNYAAWYSYLSQESQGKIFKLTLELQKIIPGFDSFQNSKSGDVRILSAFFTRPSKAAYRLNELSHGQKALIALYTLIYCSPDENFTLCIDEPENFLALPEIQPWLRRVMDYCLENEAQAMLISHHPSLINYLASNSGYWFEREDNEAVRVRRITDTVEEGLSVAKLIELGWIYDE
ncbi:AAA family ATPase [Microcoleus sp. CAWBG58]|uniref:AAA family ATPase n=1 Tax=Microcoleus sp. CAWBG58 TaxID=2841651 RepID=UPI0025CD1D6D|nr:ATP-binding protein [Microcoleus sp. CAWBG58]